MPAATSENSGNPGTTRFPGLVSCRGGLPSVVVLVVVVLVSALMVGSPLEQSKAAGMQGGRPAAAADNAQVRIIENGRTVGGGTLVDRNWVLTALHLFDRSDDLSAYAMRFGVVDDRTDATGTANLRTFDRIVPHEQLPDLAMVHFADPVPETTWIPQLARRVPARYDRAFLFGWGHPQIP
jgi:hypothetical protein